MAKNSKPGTRAAKDDLYVPPFTREMMRRGVMGKYYRDVTAASNVVRIEPELSRVFRNELSVNQALRELVRLRKALESITEEKGRRRKSA